MKNNKNNRTYEKRLILKKNFRLNFFLNIIVI